MRTTCLRLLDDVVAHFTRPQGACLGRTLTMMALVKLMAQIAAQNMPGPRDIVRDVTLRTLCGTLGDGASPTQFAAED